MEVLAILVLINALCGMYCSILASSRAINLKKAFFIGLILGPIGLLIMIFMPDRRRDEALAAQITAAAATAQAAAAQIAFLTSQLQPEGLAECPRCAEIIRKRAKVCRFCGYEIPPDFSATAVERGQR